MPADLIIDADSHITEPPDVWTARVPSKYRDDVPRVVRRGTADTWVLGEESLAPVGVTAPAGWPGAGLGSNIPLIEAMSTSIHQPELAGGRPGTRPVRACSLMSSGDTIEPPRE